MNHSGKFAPSRDGEQNLAAKEYHSGSKSRQDSKNDPELNRLTDKFQALMQKDTTEILSEKSDLQKSRQDREQGQNPAPASMADAILASMGKVETRSPEQVAGKEQSGNFAKTAEAICERILVSEKDVSGRQEIRISLKNDILPDTEIRLVRDDKGLHITLVTTSAESRQFLESRQQGLEDFLSQRMKEKFSVSVSDDRKQQSEQGDSGQDQGRSRQQRNLYDEMKFI
jgi:type III secretion system needle length determinant